MSITFNHICTLLETMENQSSNHARSLPERENSIRLVISNWFLEHRKALNSSDGGAVLSIIFPHRRKDRVYALKPPSLSRKLVKLLSLQNGEKALMEGWAHGKHGDLGAITERIIKPRDGSFKTPPSISIDKVDNLLTQLAAKTRFSDPAIRAEGDPKSNTDLQLKWLLGRLSSWETKWLVRILLRDHCTIQLDEFYFFRMYHFLLPDLLLFQNDFGAAFALLGTELSSYPAVPNADQETGMRIEAAKKLRATVGIKVGRPTFHKAWSFKNCLQLTGRCAWAADVKYDGEYCEIHVDLDSPGKIKIFSKNGKDATNDRQALRDIILRALRIGRPDCVFKRRCIVLGELVVYSDKEQKILPFSKIRKHVRRSGSFIGTAQDSMPHEWEHLMIVFFDVLVVDDDHVMREGLQRRRDILRDLVHHIPGRAQRSEWYLLDFKDSGGIADLKDSFARSLVHHQEGLVLKPLHAPYFPLLDDTAHRHRGYFIKLKKDYLADLGGERDLGDFAVVGGSFDAQVAARSGIKPQNWTLHWTHFHIGCLTNKADVERVDAKPRFQIVGALSIDKCIPKVDVKYLNLHGRLSQMSVHEDGNSEAFDFEHPLAPGPRMTAAFRRPFVVEVLGGGYEKLQNERFEMLRHPRVKKIHQDRTWNDTVTVEDLERMANEQWQVPDADKLNGHARDIALLVKKYAKEITGSQTCTSPVTDSTQESTQCTTQRTSQPTPRPRRQITPGGSVFRETHSVSTQATWATASTSSQCSISSTQHNGTRASFQARSFLVREDTSERIAEIKRPTRALQHPGPSKNQPDPPAAGLCTPSAARKRPIIDTEEQAVTPPYRKRRRMRGPLIQTMGNKSAGNPECNCLKNSVPIMAKHGCRCIERACREDRRLTDEYE